MMLRAAFALVIPFWTLGAQQPDRVGRLPVDRSRPVPTKSEIIAAWQQRQAAINTFRIDIDYARDARWGWVPSGWQVTEMLADGSKRLVSTARVTSYAINAPIGAREFR